jgi:hypothetical protein
VSSNRLSLALNKSRAGSWIQQPSSLGTHVWYICPPFATLTVSPFNGSSPQAFSHRYLIGFVLGHGTSRATEIDTVCTRLKPGSCM